MPISRKLTPILDNKARRSDPTNLLRPCTQNGNQNSLHHLFFYTRQDLHACDSGQDTYSANHHGNTVELYMLYTQGTPAIFKIDNINITNQTPDHALEFR